MKTREIKFRAWDNKTLKMSPAFALFGEFTLMGAVHAWQHEMGNNAKTSLEALGDLEVMQYTGLKDKNGKEIYEGDVITTRIDTLGYVTFFNGAWRLKHKDSITPIPVPMYVWSKAYEVIGDIYRNPELLNGTVERGTKNAGTGKAV